MKHSYAIINFIELNAPIGEEAYTDQILVETDLDRARIDEIAQEAARLINENDDYLDLAWDDRLREALDKVIETEPGYIKRVDTLTIVEAYAI